VPLVALGRHDDVVALGNELRAEQAATSDARAQKQQIIALARAAAGLGYARPHDAQPFIVRMQEIAAAASDLDPVTTAWMHRARASTAPRLPRLQGTQTALHLAVGGSAPGVPALLHRAGHCACADLLLASGANLEAKNKACAHLPAGTPSPLA
jgi:hypothetical protein